MEKHEWLFCIASLIQNKKNRYYRRNISHKKYSIGNVRIIDGIDQWTVFRSKSINYRPIFTHGFISTGNLNFTNIIWIRWKINFFIKQKQLNLAVSVTLVSLITVLVSLTPPRGSVSVAHSLHHAHVIVGDDILLPTFAHPLTHIRVSFVEPTYR